MVSPTRTCEGQQPLSDMIEWITSHEAAQALAITTTTVTSWALAGKLAGSAKDDRGAWLVRRSEVNRVRAERDARAEVSKQDPGQWVPMTERREERYS